MTPRSLDPLENPWKRGDVCTRGFGKVGFVVRYTPGYLEILWPIGVERVPADDVDNIRRMAHWDSVPPGGQRTNLETLESLEALETLSNALENRTFKNDHEKRELDNLIRRAFATDGCEWDKKHSTQLLTLALDPERVGIIFKLRERLHRYFCGR
jgi:hypothetical protein